MKAMLLTIVLFFSSFSHAALVQLHSERSVYQLGETITVTLKISDFSETLGGFTAEMLYPKTLLTLLGWQFGTGFDDGLGDYPFDDHDADAGVIFLSNYADIWADESVLASKQGNSFVLATFSLLASSVGELWLGLTPAELSVLSFDNQFIDVTGSGLALTINPTQVPAPAALLLILSGLLLMRRRA